MHDITLNSYFSSYPPSYFLLFFTLSEKSITYICEKWIASNLVGFISLSYKNYSSGIVYVMKYTIIKIICTLFKCLNLIINQIFLYLFRKKVRCP